MSETIAPLELEKYLNDNSKILILHALDGEIWGASVAATELFGYTNDEIKQMYLANIKPKTLRLSDVCKTQKGDDSAIIFERRNGRRFAAKVSTKIIRTTVLRAAIDLVLLELSIVNTDNTNLPRSPQLNINETTDYIQTLSREICTPVKHVKAMLRSLKLTSLTPEQEVLVKNIGRYYDDIHFLNENITDTIKIGVNILKLEQQPFNVIDMLSNFVASSGKLIDNISIAIDRSVPELVYGDENRLGKICFGLTRKCIQALNPEQITLLVRKIQDDEKPEAIHFTIGALNCNIEKLQASTQVDEENEQEQLDSFFDSTPVFVARNLVRVMGGSMSIEPVNDNSIEISFWIDLPEVHDLGLNGNRRFLQNQHVILLDEANSMLSQQLYMWGAMVEQFHSVDSAMDYASTKTDLHKLIIIVNLIDKGQYDGQSLNALLTIRAANILVIKPQRLSIKCASNIMQIPSPYEPSMLGNMLSQFVAEDFPFPYSNSHRKRSEAAYKNEKRILIVDDNEDVRELHREILSKEDIDIDIAVNGIDAVLACAHNQYDVILMDIHLPYMDGFEAVVHIRKISELNANTPIIIISGDSSENARLTMKQIGVETMLDKPVDIPSLIGTVRECSAIAKRNREELHGSREETRNRRSEESIKAGTKKEVPVNAEMIYRLETDTTRDVCREMVDMFIEESLVTISELESGCRTGDWKTVASHAHSLCSSSKTFGCEALHEIAKQLENESKKNNLGECMRLASQLPQVFLMSQRGLYDICNREIN